MLRELGNIAQLELPFIKRWFHSPTANLFLWELNNEITMIQYSFESKGKEIVFSWKKEKGISINTVHNTQSNLGMKASELITTELHVSKKKIWQSFFGESSLIPSHITTLIKDILEQGDPLE